MCNLGCMTISIIVALIMLVPLLFAKMITGAFVVLGFTSGQAFLLLLLCLTGGLMNIPVKKWPGTNFSRQNGYFYFPGFERFLVPSGKILAVNLGGALIPGLVSLWEIWRIHTEFTISHPSSAFAFWTVFSVNTYVCYITARPVEGKGIVIPAFIPPFVVAVLSLILAPAIAPVIAFPAGVLGVLTGADIMHMKDIRNLDAPMISIGGAGTFDGIFLCGTLAVFLTG